MKKQSEFGKLNTPDFWKGLVVAGFSTATTALIAVLDSTEDFTSFKWQGVVLAAIGGFAGYISKNLLSNSDGQVFTAEKK